MFETFSNTVENEHTKKIGTDYDVDQIRTHGVTIGKFKPSVSNYMRYLLNSVNISLMIEV